MLPSHRWFPKPTQSTPVVGLRPIRAWLPGALLLWMLVTSGAGAADSPWLSLDRGLSSSNALFNPGKVDLLYKHLKNESRYNAFGWTPVFKGGYGWLDPDQGSGTHYGGGYLRPLASQPKYGDLIVGGLWVNNRARTDWEFQGE